MKIDFKNKKTLILSAIAGISVIILISLFSFVGGSNFEKLTIKTAQGKDVTFKVEIADTPETWSSGLMNRKEMPEKQGMLFEMKDGIKTFWMKDTYIPLDIIFIDKKGTIKTIQKNATPMSLAYIGSRVSVNGVLEINGGLSDKLGIAVGDTVDHSYFKSAK